MIEQQKKIILKIIKFIPVETPAQFTLEKIHYQSIIGIES
jgi:hypothetical protein